MYKIFILEKEFQLITIFINLSHTKSTKDKNKL